MTSPSDLLAAYKTLNDDEKEQFWAIIYSSESNQSPLPPPSQDVIRSLEGLLVRASVLGPEAKREEAYGWRSALGGPSSTAAIESTATAMAKWWAAATAAGGSLAWVVAWRAAISDFWSNTTTTGAERIAVIALAAATMVAVVMAIAIMVSADVKARAVASAAQYHARAAIADAYLKSGTRHPDLAARQLAILAGIEAAGQKKTLSLVMPGADVDVHETQRAEGVLRVRDKPADQWTTVPTDADFKLE